MGLLRNFLHLLRKYLLRNTQMPFQHPWILLEDGYTYEKTAIIKYVEDQKKLFGQEGNARVVKSPACGIALKTLSLYPNKLLYQMLGLSIPEKQDPLLIAF